MSIQLINNIHDRAVTILLLAAIFTALLAPAGAAARTRAANDDRNESATDEMRASARRLLTEIARQTGQLSAPENRIRAATTVAGLLWDEDEKAARALFQTALGELRALLAAINPPAGAEEMSRAEKAAHYAKRATLAALRREFLETLAERDAPAALAALAALKLKVLDAYDPLVADELELQLSALIAAKDRARSYEVAKRQLDENGVNYRFIQALKALHKINSSLAADLAKDALTKIKNAKIRVSPATGRKTDEATTTPVVEFYQAGHFVDAIAEMTRAAARDETKKTQPPLTAAEFKELVEHVAAAFLAAPDAAPTSISQMMPQIAAYAPATAQRIRQKIGAENAKQVDKIVESHQFYTDVTQNSADEMAKEAERSAPEVRDQRLAAAAYKAIEEDDAVKAHEIAARIKERQNHEYLFEVIKDALPLSQARRGATAAVKKMLAALKTDREKARLVAELASALAAKGDREAAKKLLDESLALVPANPRNHEELASTVRFAEAYAFAAPERAFAILENAAAQMDAYIAAGIVADEFHLAGSTEGGELLLGTIIDQYLTHVPNPTALLINLARADFARAAALADKFQRPEIRLFVRLRLVEAVLDENAAAKMKRTRERIAAEQEH